MDEPPNNHGGWGIGNIGPIPEGLVAWWIAAPLLLICLRPDRQEVQALVRRTSRRRRFPQP